MAKLKSWASEIDEGTRRQAERLARLPVVSGHVALMPDAHLGIGATVGSVIPTENAIIPSAVGVDIGCGMVAVQTSLLAGDLPDTLQPLIPRFARSIPAGLGAGHPEASRAAQAWLDAHPIAHVDDKLRRTAAGQLGSLGSGNHFLEVCLDEQDRVWVVLHSGSRGVGNRLAEGHIKRARQLAKQLHLALEDPDLAYFLDGTPDFAAYIGDMLWAQDYALQNRELMMDAALQDVFRYVGAGREERRINCHHNFAALEVHGGRSLWITRKGAIRARQGDLGVIPGSMGTCSYIVEGKGNPDSYCSSAHGAGRRMSRGQARRTLTVQSLQERMGGKAWNADRPEALLDEHPDAYKDIEQVMADQADLVSALHVLTQVANYKGV